MALISLRQLLDHGAEKGYAVPAFNINNMEQGLAILNAAKKCDSPVILQASRGARSYAGDIMLSYMVQALTEMYPDIPICDNWSLHREFVIKRQEYLQNLDNLSNGFRKFGYN